MAKRFERVAVFGIPVVTAAIVVVNLAVYLVELVRPETAGDLAMYGVSTGPDGRIVAGGGVTDGGWHRLLTGAFVHSLPTSYFGAAHILFNMGSLVLLGGRVERLLGSRVQFLAWYLLSALGGSTAVYLIEPDLAVVGASGAVFGLFGAYFVITWRRPDPGRPLVTTLFGINVVVTLLPTVSWQVHLGGLLVGATTAVAHEFVAAKSNHRAVQLATFAGVGAVLCALVAIKTVDLVGT